MYNKTIISEQSDFSVEFERDGSYSGVLTFDGDVNALVAYQKQHKAKSRFRTLDTDFIVDKASLKRRVGNKGTLSLYLKNPTIERNVNDLTDPPKEPDPEDPIVVLKGASVSVTMVRDNIPIEEKAYEGLDPNAPHQFDMYKFVELWKKTPIEKKKVFTVTDDDGKEIVLSDDPNWKRIAFVLKRIERGTTTYTMFHPSVSISFVSVKPPDISKMNTTVGGNTIGGIPKGDFIFVLTGCNSTFVDEPAEEGSIAFTLDGKVAGVMNKKIKSYWKIEYVYEGFKSVDVGLYTKIATGE